MTQTSGGYRTITEVLDFGPFISKVVVFPEVSPAGAVLRREDFTVHARRRTTGEDLPWPAFMGEKPNIPMEGERKILSAYVSDEEGNANEKGSCITLTLECDPRDNLGSIIYFNGIFNVLVESEYAVQLTSPILCADAVIEPAVFDKDMGGRIVLGDLLAVDAHEDPDIPLRYSYFEPGETGEEGKIPLLIWLHGMGEGGTDTKVPAISNRVVNLITPQIQAFFGGKAYLLVPQCPTWWMDPGDKSLAEDGRSLYIEPLYRLFTDFIKDHPAIDTSRVYIGGDSNGGYMSVNMVINYPDLFAASFPVCEAYRDEFIDEEKLKKLASVPTWFTAAKTDTVVPVEKYVVPTYLRLKAAGAKVHFTLWERVEDRSGQFVLEDGRPFEYAGHWSWIPMLNNEDLLDYDGKPVVEDGREVSILEWIAMQKKN